MKKVLLMGDSIRMGYDEFVRDLLKDTCEVVYEEDNGRFSAYSLWQINQIFRRERHFDVVHWNNGYWDMHIEPPMSGPIHPVTEYVSFLRRMLAEIRRNGARPIFATTTPILAPEAADALGYHSDWDHYRDEWVREYNGAAVALMTAEGVPVNDLYALCKKDPQYYKCPDRLHLTEEGYRRCAGQVAAMVVRELEKI